jgi:hypothetical protein
MRDSIHSTQVVTPFGSGYVPEDHGRGPALEEPRKRSRTKLAMVLTVALFGATTAAAAITASHRNCAPVPKLSQQSQPSILLKLPGSFGFEDALY